ncbi:MAG: hypothetical protein ACYC0F_18645 [Rhodanobacter sp.]
MSTVIRDDLASLLAVKLGPVIEEYRLKIIRVDDEEALVVGSNYALRFAADRDSLDVAYIERNSRSRLTAYTLRPLVMQRFTPEDRANYGHPMTVKDRLLASLSVYASGLANRCRDVLSGDKSWLRRDGWSEESPSSAIEQLLQDELPESRR